MFSFFVEKMPGVNGLILGRSKKQQVNLTFTQTSFVGWWTYAAERPFTIFASTSIQTRSTGTFIIICQKTKLRMH